MSVQTPVTFRTVLPPRPQHTTPTSPDSFMSTPPSPPPDAPAAFHTLPFVLCESSRPTSPSSDARVKLLAEQIRKKEVRDLYLVSTRLRGPFAPGASRWGRKPAKEEFDEEDLVLPDTERQAEDLLRKRDLRRKQKSDQEAAMLKPQMAVVSEPEDGRFPLARTPALTAFSPQDTSTPVAATNTNSQGSQSQSSLNFSLSKPYLATSISKPRGMDLPSSSSSSLSIGSLPTDKGAAVGRKGQPMSSSPARADFRPPDLTRTGSAKGRRAPYASSSQIPMPFNSQFDIDGRVGELSRFLDKDAFQVERGVIEIDSD